MVHPHTVHLPLGALLSPCTVCVGAGEECEIGFFGQIQPDLTGVAAAIDGGDGEVATNRDFSKVAPIVYNETLFQGGPLEFSISRAYGRLARTPDSAGWVSAGRTWCTPTPCTSH